MKVNIAWPISLGLLCLVLIGHSFYRASWVPDYAVAEPLVAPLAEFGQELVRIREAREVKLTDFQDLLRQDRFSAIRPYGLVFRDAPGYIVSVRVNKTFSFHINERGHPEWQKKTGQ